MIAKDPNVALIEAVARGLGVLASRMVFVGGSTIGLLVTDKARPPVRSTKDVDLFVEVTTQAEYYNLAEELRTAGLTQDNSAEFICRWRLGSVTVDVMPTDERILGFANSWSKMAIRTAITAKLPSGFEIKLADPPVLLATKIEAFYGRGKGDFRGSHDVEDVINLVDGREELSAECARTEAKLRAYLREELDDFLGTPGFVDAIAWHLGPSAEEQARQSVIVERLRRIAGI